VTARNQSKVRAVGEVETGGRIHSGPGVAINAPEAAGAAYPAAPIPNLAGEIPALDRFSALDSHVLDRALSALPWLAAALLILLVPIIYDAMFLSGLVAVAVAALLLRKLFDESGEVLQQLWDRQLLLVPAEPKALVGTSEGSLRLGRLEWPRIWPKIRSLRLPRDRYEAYMEELQAALNSRVSWLAGLVLAILMSMTFSYRYATFLHINTDPGALLMGLPILWTYAIEHGAWAELAFEIPQILVAFVLGLFMWRLIVLAYGFHRLGDLFDINIQPQHPDQCGGMKPVGTMCLLAAAVIAVPAIFVGVWIMLSQSPTSHYHGWVGFYSALWTLFAVGALMFLVPVYGIHRSMLRRRTQLRVSLDQFSVRVNELVHTLVVSAESAAPDQVEELSKQISQLQLVYASTDHIPVWPVDRGILQKFGTAQIIPLLTVTNLAPIAAQRIQEWLRV
jgi:hypothetical protein